MAARPTDADSRARAHRAAEVRQASDVSVVPGGRRQKGHVEADSGERPPRVSRVRRTLRQGVMSLRTLGVRFGRVGAGPVRLGALRRGQARAAVGSVGIGRRAAAARRGPRRDQRPSRAPGSPPGARAGRGGRSRRSSSRSGAVTCRLAPSAIDRDADVGGRLGHDRRGPARIHDRRDDPRPAGRRPDSRRASRAPVPGRPASPPGGRAAPGGPASRGGPAARRRRTGRAPAAGPATRPGSMRLEGRRRTARGTPAARPRRRAAPRRGASIRSAPRWMTRPSVSRPWRQAGGAPRRIRSSARASSMTIAPAVAAQARTRSRRASGIAAPVGTWTVGETTATAASSGSPSGWRPLASTATAVERRPRQPERPRQDDVAGVLDDRPAVRPEPQPRGGADPDDRAGQDDDLRGLAVGAARRAEVGGDRGPEEGIARGIGRGTAAAGLGEHPPLLAEQPLEAPAHRQRSASAPDDADAARPEVEPRDRLEGAAAVGRRLRGRRHRAAAAAGPSGSGGRRADRTGRHDARAPRRGVRADAGATIVPNPIRPTR